MHPIGKVSLHQDCACFKKTQSKTEVQLSVFGASGMEEERLEGEKMPEVLKWINPGV